MLISDSVPNLVGGVSQQVYTQRSSSQCARADNWVPSIADGLKKRPPSRHVALLTSSDLSAAAIHTINRDTTERYVVAITDGDLRVFDLAGVEQTVAFPNGKTYLAAANPATSFDLLTIADHTFVANETITVAMGSAVSTSRPHEAMVNVRQGNYGRTYSISIDGTQRASYTTADGGTSTDSQDIDTANIATQLYNDLVAWGGSGFSFARIGSAIHISNATADFSIGTEDGFNGAAMTAAKDRLQDYNDLPVRAAEGFQVEITGEPGAAGDNYYVVYELAVSGDTDGVWRETLAQGLQYQLDASTMPHILVRESDGTFTFRQATWDDREVGDDETGPVPSFVGKTITELYFHRNRLGFLADEGCVLSRAGSFYDFFRTTMTALLDDDPIDIQVSDTGRDNSVTVLRHAVPWKKRLVIFSDQVQFELTGGDLLTPRTASLLPSTSFPCATNCAPVSAGKNIYFASEGPSYARVREYFVTQSIDDLTEDAADVTRHISTYIPAGVRRMVAADDEDTVVLLSSGDPSALYVYRYYWDRDEKLQSAWGKWSFASTDTILDVAFLDTVLYLVVARSDGTYLESVDLDPGAADTSSIVDYRMDRKVYESDCTVSYDTGTNVTTVTLPYADDGSLWVITRSGNTHQDLPEGYVVAHTRPSSTTVALSGDWTTALLCVGRRYTAVYDFSPFLVREQAERGAVSAMLSGRLQIGKVTVQYSETASFVAEVTPEQSGVTYRYAFTGDIVGTARLAAFSLEDGSFSFPVRAKNDRVQISITSDHYLPVALTSAEWEGQLTLRSRR